MSSVAAQTVGLEAGEVRSHSQRLALWRSRRRVPDTLTCGELGARGGQVREQWRASGVNYLSCLGGKYLGCVKLCDSVRQGEPEELPEEGELSLGLQVTHPQVSLGQVTEEYCTSRVLIRRQG